MMLVVSYSITLPVKSKFVQEYIGVEQYETMKIRFGAVPVVV